MAKFCIQIAMLPRQRISPKNAWYSMAKYKTTQSVIIFSKQWDWTIWFGLVYANTQIICFYWCCRFFFFFFSVTEAPAVVAATAKKAGLISFNGVRIFPTHRFNLDLTIFVIRVCWLWWRIMALLRNNMAFHVMAQSVKWRWKERHGCEKGNIGLSATRCILIDVL